MKRNILLISLPFTCQREEPKICLVKFGSPVYTFSNDTQFIFHGKENTFGADVFMQNKIYLRIINSRTHT